MVTRSDATTAAAKASHLDRLKLIAMDEDDLAIVSAHVQDAVGHARALEFDRARSTFALALNRYVWEQDRDRRTPERRRALLQFAHVRGVRMRGIEREEDRALSLLAVRFEAEGEGPDGTVELVFSGDAGIRLDVECIEARLSDTDAAWAARMRPQHPAD